MSGPEPLDPLPSSHRALARSLQLGYRAEPLLLVVAFVTTVAAAVPDALFAVGLAELTESVLAADGYRIALVAVGLAFLGTGSWLLGVLSERVSQRLTDRAAVPIESHAARLLSSVITIEHHERPDHLDRLSLLRDQAAALAGLYQSLFSTAGAALRLIITLAVLAHVEPLLGLLGLFAVPTVLVTNWRASIERNVEESVAQYDRRARHLFLLGTTAAPGKEVRVAGVQSRLRRDRREAWELRYRALGRARSASARWQAGALALFGLGYASAIAYVATRAGSSPGQVMLVLAAGSRLSHYVGQSVSATHLLRTIWLDVTRRLVWLEDVAAASLESGDQPVPDRIRRGIRFDHVSFRYPGTERLVLDDLTLDLPAGKVVAVVGVNGAGKSSLVKLLCRFYQPSTGQLSVDDTDLCRIPPARWRERLTGAFQDFYCFEYPVQQSVGVGDLAHVDDPGAVGAAVRRAGADDVVAGLGRGLETQLGGTWDEGTELSHGQWQKLALARAFMRPYPWLIVLDEPTSALDAETEHALFERYAAAARQPDERRSGRITLLVSHRFSTVRMADLIVVIDGGRLVEQGSHEELMSRGGQYAELYRLQASSYR